MAGDERPVPDSDAPALGWATAALGGHVATMDVLPRWSPVSPAAYLNSPQPTSTSSFKGTRRPSAAIPHGRRGRPPTVLGGLIPGHSGGHPPGPRRIARLDIARQDAHPTSMPIEADRPQVDSARWTRVNRVAMAVLTGRRTKLAPRPGTRRQFAAAREAPPDRRFVGSICREVCPRPSRCLGAAPKERPPRAHMSG